MIRRTAIVAVACLALAGCITGKEITDRVAAVQTYTRTFCNFVPAIGGITSLFNRDAGAGVTDVGAAICTVVNAAPLADGPANFRVRGVRVTGVFVR